MGDHYTTLGVQCGASDKDIRTAYRRLAKAYHPDRNQEGGDLFKEITAAYEVLCDTASREAYDSKRHQEAQKSAPVQLSEQDEACVVERAKEDAAKMRRREPISGYMFVGREKEMFDAQLHRDKEKQARRRQGSADVTSMARAAERVREEEAASCEERARQRAAAAEAQREQEMLARERARTRAAAEAEQEWREEVARLEKEREAAARQEREACEQAEADRREESRHQYVETLLSAHEEQLQSYRQSMLLSSYADKNLASLPDASLSELRTLVEQWTHDINRELRRRRGETDHTPSPLPAAPRA